MTSARPRAVIGAGLVVALLLIGFLVLALSSGGAARSGTTVEGVDISGLTQEQAAAAVTTALGPRSEARLKVTALDTTFKFTPEEAGLALDAETSVAPAFGRTWNPVSLVTDLFGTTELPAVAKVNEALLESELDVMSDAIDVPAVEPRVAIKKGKPKVTEGEPGRAIDREATATMLTRAFLAPRAPLEAVVVSVEPTVSDAEVQDAVALANQAMSSPVTVVAGSVNATIPAKAVGRALSFTADGGVLVPQLNGAKLHRAIADELKPIEVPGRNATFKIRKGKPKVVKSKVGRGVADDELASAVSGVLALPPAERKVTVSVGTRPPELTTEEAKQLGVKERLSTFTQSYPYAAYRSQNLGQAAKRINGTLLMPGDTFSLNDTLLERTEENGYTSGYVVGPGGVFKEDLGGGVSTSATTAWTAAFYAGMERVQTVAHSIWISRYKPGLEATVAWGIFDMKFRNSLENAVFMTASTTPTSITVSMWGTKEYDKIEAEYGERTNIVPYSDIYDESEECKGQNGVDGFTITVDRVFYKDGKEVKREPITTRYKPAPDVTCGKKPAKDKKPDKKKSDSQSSTAPPAGDKPASKPSDKPASKPADKPADSGGTDEVFTNG